MTVQGGDDRLLGVTGYVAHARCNLNRPTEVIHGMVHVMGIIERGWAGPVAFAQGTVNVGQVMTLTPQRQLVT